MNTADLSADDLRRWRRRASLSTYLQPISLAARLAAIRSFRDLGNHFGAGVSYLKDWVLSGP